MPHCVRYAAGACVLAGLLVASPGLAADFVSVTDAKPLDMRPYWSIDLPLSAGQQVDRLVTVDDNLYVITADNRVLAVHIGTGVLRWMADLARPDQRVLGPTHGGAYAYFTSQAGVSVFHRQTGRPGNDPRSVRGFVIEVVGESTSVNVGSVHGLSRGDVLDVVRPLEARGERGEKIGELKLAVVEDRQARGILSNYSPVRKPQSGDWVRADVKLPLSLVGLPFAPSSAAISDNEALYYGGSNGRFYKLAILTGLRMWQFTTSGVVSATPRLHKGNLIIADQDGVVRAVGSTDKTERWRFNTEGAVFAELCVDDSGVYVASTDRSLYALTPDGRQRWRRQFQVAELGSPVVAGETLFIKIEGDGLYALDVKTGEQKWRMAGDASFLGLEGDRAWVVSTPPWVDRKRTARDVYMCDVSNGKLLATTQARNVSLTAGQSGPLTLILADRGGRVQCLRSLKHPHITPDQLAAVLASDAEARAGAPRSAATEAGPVRPGAKETKLPDPFRSTSTARPVGGHGLVETEGAKPAAGEEKGEEEADEEAAEEDEETADEDEVGESEDEDSEDEDTSDEDEGDDEGDDESGDDEPDEDDDGDEEP